MEKSDFVHLHNHTLYSMLDASCKIEDMIKKVKDMGQTAIAITDHGNMYGMVDFYNECVKNDIKPIIGCEIYVAPGSMYDKSGQFTGDGGKHYNHLILLAENETGYKNLNEIVTTGFLEGFYYKPRVDIDVLKKHSEGIIATSACIGGSVPQAILSGDTLRAKELAVELRDIFGKDNFFIEIQDHGLMEQKKANPELIKIAEEIGVGVVCANDVHFLEREHKTFHDYLLCINSKSKMTDEKRFSLPNDQFYLKSTEEMEKLFGYYPEAIKNTVRIAERCNVKLDIGNNKLPVFDLPEDYKGTKREFIYDMCMEGAKRELPHGLTDEYRERLEMELDIIEQKGYLDYFLVVADYIRAAKDMDIAVGIGRGSGAGSLVAYLMGITGLDPIVFGLYFERFLNPERPSLPDFDVDFEKDRRLEVKNYIEKKYGGERVGSIAAFQTFAGKQAIKDVARIMDVPFDKANAMSKLIDEGAFEVEKGASFLQSAYDSLPEFKKEIDSTNLNRTIFEAAKFMEGLVRNVSIHAAGVIICPDKITNYAPLAKAQADDTADDEEDDKVVSFESFKEKLPKKPSEKQVTVQVEMSTCESLGLVKMDILGLRTLDVIKDTVRNIKKQHGVDIDFKKIGYDDRKTYELLAEGKTDGVFQLESDGMKSVLRRLRPTSIFDITAVVALYRPGPMEYIPEYIENKHNPEKVVYEDQILKDILSETYGVIVYQEQVMSIFQKIGGFSLGKADVVRRAMGKKKADLLEEAFGVFKKGAEEKGIPLSVADELIHRMEKFSSYAFNKSHAACYAALAYQTAYLKAHYPKEFLTGMLNSLIGNFDKVKYYCQEVRESGIPILPPNINLSGERFESTEDGIVFSMTGIKGIGTADASSIKEEKNLNGEYLSLYDFMKRLGPYRVGPKTVTTLIEIGCFDHLGFSRNALKSVVGEYDTAVKQYSKKTKGGQFSFFDMDDDLKEAEEESLIQPDSKITDNPLLNALTEREKAGYYITSDPLKEYTEIMRMPSVKGVKDVIAAGRLMAIGESSKSNIAVAGVFHDVKQYTTKKGDLMAGFSLESIDSKISGVVFPKDFVPGLSVFDKKPVLVFGNIMRKDDGSIQLSYRDHMELPANGFNKKEVAYEIGLSSVSHKALKNLIKELDQHEGDITFSKYERGLYIRAGRECEKILPSLMLGEDSIMGTINVYIYDEEAKCLYRCHNMFYDGSRSVLERLKKECGEENIIFIK